MFESSWVGEPSPERFHEEARIYQSSRWLLTICLLTDQIINGLTYSLRGLTTDLLLRYD